MQVIWYIIIAALIDSSLGLIGAFSIFLSKSKFKKLIWILVAFAAGTLFAGGIAHLFIKGIKEVGVNNAINLFIFGFLLFYILERFIKWHHCHKIKCKVHPISYLILIGDGVHNVVDGLVIASTFLVNIDLGIITTIMIIAHEVPQELGNYAVTVYGGFSKLRALMYNFFAQSTCILGSVFGYYLANFFNYSLLIPFAAGGFVYIAASDLIPMLHEEANVKKSLISFSILVLGIVFMLLLKELI